MSAKGAIGSPCAHVDSSARGHRRDHLSAARLTRPAHGGQGRLAPGASSLGGEPDAMAQRAAGGVAPALGGADTFRKLVCSSARGAAGAHISRRLAPGRLGADGRAGHLPLPRALRRHIERAPARSSRVALGELRPRGRGTPRYGREVPDAARDARHSRENARHCTARYPRTRARARSLAARRYDSRCNCEASGVRRSCGISLG